MDSGLGAAMGREPGRGNDGWVPLDGWVSTYLTARSRMDWQGGGRGMRHLAGSEQTRAEGKVAGAECATLLVTVYPGQTGVTDCEL